MYLLEERIVKKRMRLDMATLNFITEIDAEIQKVGLPVAKVANPANRGNNQEKISNFSRISNAYSVIFILIVSLFPAATLD